MDSLRVQWTPSIDRHTFPSPNGLGDIENMGQEFMGLQVVGPSPGDVFADEAMSFEIVNATVRITFVVCRNSEPSPPCDKEFTIIGRLVMPLESAQKFSLGLYDFLKGAGHDPSQLISEGQTPN
ncbi:MAG: hypothetical protein IPK89_04760 [Sphingomonadales bacterium]|jgi:hypothetical protein|nr:hypothetical protein [Sphingomonadales bacterium]MBK6718691.1 hypothetical protein [Sphingomonadales bacterium]MBK8272291.1 hypothetical protein [Sphingomonadales bacterium]